LVTGFSDSLNQTIVAGYAENPFCTYLKKALPLHENCFEREGLLLVNENLLIPKNLDLRCGLIKI
jgi:hypothetical protein